MEQKSKEREGQTAAQLIRHWSIRLGCLDDRLHRIAGRQERVGHSMGGDAGLRGPTSP